jgi:hypothetical protein
MMTVNNSHPKRIRLGILYLPIFKSETTIAWFWSGINLSDEKKEYPYKKYFEYQEFYNKYKDKIWNQF